MIPKPLLVLLAAALLAPGGASLVQLAGRVANAQNANPKWRTDAASSLALAKRSKRPVLLNFGTSWCSLCHQLSRTTLRSAPFTREGANWVLLKIDPEKSAANLALERKYGVQGYPTIIFAAPDGREISRVEGFFPGKVVPAMTAARAKAKAQKRIARP